MRMPFTEFIISGDLKFIIAFVIFCGVAVYHFVKKVQAKKSEESEKLVSYHNSRIRIASIWILILSGFSLLLGFMHSFYIIGKAGGVATHLLFQGISYILITPVLGVGMFIICKILKALFNLKTTKSQQS